MDLTATPSTFAAEVGPVGPVAVVGGRTAWTLGGVVAPDTRLVTAPTGITDHEPSEMTVRVGAGTTVAAVDGYLARTGQCVALPATPDATVGGVLATGRSGIRRLGWGPVRDAVLEIRYVSAEGELVTAGGPMIKNVSGFDLCRLMVGSLGTLGLFADAILRTRPVPECEQWLSGPADPEQAMDLLEAAVSVLWDGATTWILLSGRAVDVEAQQARAAGTGFVPCPSPPIPPTGRRWSLPPAELATIPSRWPDLPFLAEMGVGIVHTDQPRPDRTVPYELIELHHRLKTNFDPENRLNPGRDPLDM